MGNTNYTLAVRTEKNVYHCGETVNGRVYLCVNDTHGITANSLNIHFSGTERGIVHYTADRERNGTYYNDDFYERNEIEMMNFDVPINTPAGSVFQRGQYEMPFQFVVPPNLPSSMFCRYGQSKCEIRYEMRAYLYKNGVSSFGNPFNSNTISSQPLRISIFGGNDTMSVPHLNQPINFPGYSHPVRACCCFKRGKMELRASLDSGIFVPNQNRSLSFELKNGSIVPIERVRVELIERVYWKPGMHHEAHNFTLFQHDIDGSSHEDWMNTTEQMIENTMQEFESLSPNSRSNNPCQLVNLSIPNNSRDTYSGRMIQVEHFVRVKVVTRGCCVSNPETTIDISIMRPSQASFTSNNTTEPAPPPSAPHYEDEDIPVVEATPLPVGWSPVTSEVFNVPMANVISISSGGEEDFGRQHYQAPAPLASSIPSPSAPPMGK